MEQPSIRLVIDNTRRLPVRVASAKSSTRLMQAVAFKVRYVFAALTFILGVPLRFAVTGGRACVSFGERLFQALVRLVVGLLGIALIGFVGYGILRLMLHWHH